MEVPPRLQDNVFNVSAQGKIFQGKIQTVSDDTLTLQTKDGKVLILHEVDNIELQKEEEETHVYNTENSIMSQLHAGTDTYANKRAKPQTMTSEQPRRAGLPQDHHAKPGYFAAAPAPKASVTNGNGNVSRSQANGRKSADYRKGPTAQFNQPGVCLPPQRKSTKITPGMFPAELPGPCVMQQSVPNRRGNGVSPTKWANVAPEDTDFDFDENNRNWDKNAERLQLLATEAKGDGTCGQPMPIPSGFSAVSHLKEAVSQCKQFPSSTVQNVTLVPLPDDHIEVDLMHKYYRTFDDDVWVPAISASSRANLFARIYAAESSLMLQYVEAVGLRSADIVMKMAHGRVDVGETPKCVVIALHSLQGAFALSCARHLSSRGAHVTVILCAADKSLAHALFLQQLTLANNAVGSLTIVETKKVTKGIVSSKAAHCFVFGCDYHLASRYERNQDDVCEKASTFLRAVFDEVRKDRNGHYSVVIDPSPVCTGSGGAVATEAELQLMQVCERIQARSYILPGPFPLPLSADRDGVVHLANAPLPCKKLAKPATLKAIVAQQKLFATAATVRLSRKDDM